MMIVYNRITIMQYNNVIVAALDSSHNNPLTNSIHISSHCHYYSQFYSQG